MEIYPSCRKCGLDRAGYRCICRKPSYPPQSVEQSYRLATYFDQDSANRAGWAEHGDDGQMVG